MAQKRVIRGGVIDETSITALSLSHFTHQESIYHISIKGQRGLRHGNMKQRILQSCLSRANVYYGRCYEFLAN